MATTLSRDPSSSPDEARAAALLAAVRARRPRMGADLAARIDRLARRAHARYAFAHHPLCDRYAPEVLRLGRHRLCLGCALASQGALVGLVAGALGRPSAPAALAALLCAVALGAWSLRARLPKLASRFAPALLCAFALCSPLLPLALALPALYLLAYRRRGPNRAQCETCPERAAPVCSGFSRQVHREQAFQRRSQQLIALGRRGSSRAP